MLKPHFLFVYLLLLANSLIAEISLFKIAPIFRHPIILKGYNSLDGKLHKLSDDGNYFYQINLRNKVKAWQLVANEGIPMNRHKCPPANLYTDIEQYSPFRALDAWENTFNDHSDKGSLYINDYSMNIEIKLDTTFFPTKFSMKSGYKTASVFDMTKEGLVAYVPYEKKDSLLRLINITQQINILWDYEFPKIIDIQFNPAKDMLVARNVENSIILLDVKTGKKIKEFSYDGRKDSFSYQRPIFSGDGKQLAIPSVENNLIYIWDTESGALMHRNGWLYTQIVSSPDYFAYAPRNGKSVNLWSLKYRTIERTLPLKDAWSNFPLLAFSPSGRYLVINYVVKNEFDRIVVYDFVKSQLVAQSDMPKGQYTSQIVFNGLDDVFITRTNLNEVFRWRFNVTHR